MIRGTTPIHVFYCDVDLSDSESLYITYEQGNTTIEKTKEDCSFSIVSEEDYKYAVEVRLTQEETLSFKTGDYKAVVQITAKFGDGTVLKSNILPVCISPTLKKEVV